MEKLLNQTLTGFKCNNCHCETSILTLTQCNWKPMLFVVVVSPVEASKQ